MDQAWRGRVFRPAQLCRLIEPFYPKPGNGRPPIGLERMLRIYLLQHWFNLSDPGVEEALYESASMRQRTSHRQRPHCGLSRRVSC